MATTTLGQSNVEPRTVRHGINKGIYWAVAAAIAIILAFALTANRNDSTTSTPLNRNMDSAPANSNTSPSGVGLTPSETGTVNNNGTFSGPNSDPLKHSSENPGTSKSPNAPKGTVER